MKVYLAAPYVARAEVRKLAEELKDIGIDVTSTWLNEDHEITSGTIGAAEEVTDGAAGVHVAKDFHDIERADALVVFTASAINRLVQGSVDPLTLNSGGRHVETGYALAKRKHVLVVGEEENIFHRILPCARDWHHAVLGLVKLRESMKLQKGALRPEEPSEVRVEWRDPVTRSQERMKDADQHARDALAYLNRRIQRDDFGSRRNA